MCCIQTYKLSKQNVQVLSLCQTKLCTYRYISIDISFGSFVSSNLCTLHSLSIYGWAQIIRMQMWNIEKCLAGSMCVLVRFEFWYIIFYVAVWTHKTTTSITVTLTWNITEHHWIHSCQRVFYLTNFKRIFMYRTNV